MRLMLVFAILCGVAGSAFASKAMSFQDLITAAENRHDYVVSVSSGITSRCIRNTWGENPPPVLRDWLNSLLLSDLYNRAKVARGELSAQAASNARKKQFYALADLPQAELASVATYAGFGPQQGFGPELIEVLDCQYRALGKALHTAQTPL